MTSNFASDDHALDTGLLISFLRSHGIGAQPTTDELGYYTSHVLIPVDTGLAEPVVMEVVVVP